MSVSALSRLGLRPFRVLMIAPTLFFKDYGCHVRILEETRVLCKLGHKPLIVTYYGGKDIRGLDIRRTIRVPWYREIRRASPPHKIVYDILLSLRVFQLIRHYRPDVVHGHLHEGALIGWPVSLLGRVPLVFDLQGSLTSEMVDHHLLRQDGPFFEPMRRLEKFIDRLPAAIITSTRHTAGLCMAEYGLRPESIFPVPDAVNADVFRPNLLSEAERRARKESMGIPSDRRVVVYLGLLAGYQGTDLLVNAAERLLNYSQSGSLPSTLSVSQQEKGHHPKVHFLIMGFPDCNRYRRLTEQFGIANHVTFTGRIPYERAPEMLALGDIAVGPKLSATEGCGKLLNYMAMGLPTVAFDTPVSREYLGEDGIYAPYGHVEGLAAAMRRLLENPEWAASRGMRLRERVIAAHSWDNVGQHLLSVYKSVMAADGRRSVVDRAHR